MKHLTAAADFEGRSVAELKAIGVILHRQIKVLKQRIADIEAEQLEIIKTIPNMTHPDAPITVWRNNETRRHSS